MINDTTIARGERMWTTFRRAMRFAGRKVFVGDVLDVGCGRGEFVRAGWRDGIATYGLDICAEFVDHFSRTCEPDLRDACFAYDGTTFPFEDRRFNAIHCWFVFEHVAEPFPTLAEMSRVAAPGCRLILNAQDGRTIYEAHAQVPWLPGLPFDLRRAWLDELTTPERRDYVLSSVFPTTGDEVVAELGYLGWHVKSLEMTGVVPVPAIAQPNDLDSTRVVAREAMAMFAAGRWPAEPLNYNITAIKF